MARTTVKNAGVTIISLDENGYISLTDIDKNTETIILLRLSGSGCVTVANKVANSLRNG